MPPQLPLPPPPALHMNAQFMNVNQGMPPAGIVRPERERGPRSGNTPRDRNDGEQERGARLVPVASSSPVVADHRVATVSPSASQYDPNKPFSSLFGGKSSGDHNPPFHDERGSESPPSSQQGAKNAREYNPAVEQRQSYDTTQRSTAAPRTKMLFDPQSNEYRTMEKEVPKAPYPNKAGPKKIERSGPPAAEIPDDSRKTMQVNRIEQNTGDKWSRAKETAQPSSSAAAVAAASRHREEPARHSAPEPSEEHEHHELGREEYLEQRKAARQKERDGRGPRTKGLLFRLTAEGGIERVFTAEEKEQADKSGLRKLERGIKPSRKGADDVDATPSHVRAPVPRVEPAAYEHLDMERLSKEEFQALPKARKDEIRAKHQEVKAARQAAGIASSSRRPPPSVSEPEELPVEAMAIDYSAGRSGRHDNADLDIQQMARETEASLSMQPIKTFVPGQHNYGGQPEVVHQQPQNWRMGAQVIPAARVEQNYTPILQPHNYPMMNLGPDPQNW